MKRTKSKNVCASNIGHHLSAGQLNIPTKQKPKYRKQLIINYLKKSAAAPSLFFLFFIILNFFFFLFLYKKKKKNKVKNLENLTSKHPKNSIFTIDFMIKKLYWYFTLVFHIA